jgi:UDP-2-acetamido-2-deoxy-ribo-hexuluronate aminotransferase
MQFIDLAIQQKRIYKELEAAIAAVLSHGRYIMGPEIGRLEDELKNFVGVTHAIGCASGTDALLLALLAEGVGPGDAVFTSTFTFIATAEVISFLGATPVFVDIDPQTYNIDPDKLDRAIRAVKHNDLSLYPVPATNSVFNARPSRPGPQAPGAGPPLPGFSPPLSGPRPKSSALEPKGIIAVDLFGLPADYERINAVAEKYRLFVIEDAAQSFGAGYRGQKAGSLGDIACTSFFPAKPLGCYGDGGMCFCDNDESAEKMLSLRVHGKGRDKYDNVRIGINARLDTLQAAILLAKFKIFPEEITLRQQVAERYHELLAAKTDRLIRPVVPEGVQSVWAQYSVLAADFEHRSALQKHLGENGIPTAVYYPKPLHLQTAFEPLGYRQGDFPVSEECSERIFSLPMHPYLTAEAQKRIVEALG